MQREGERAHIDGEPREDGARLAPLAHVELAREAAHARTGLVRAVGPPARLGGVHAEGGVRLVRGGRRRGGADGEGAHEVQADGGRLRELVERLCVGAGDAAEERDRGGHCEGELRKGVSTSPHIVDDED
jgi:hypothetical protein